MVACLIITLMLSKAAPLQAESLYRVSAHGNESHGVCREGICDESSGTEQKINDMVNYDYARTFGGYDAGSGGPISIMEAFKKYDDVLRTGSNHNLLGIQQYAYANFSYFSNDSDPCNACHNPHLCKDNKNHLQVPGYATISLPSEHFDQWGDDEEQMSDYASNYRPPGFTAPTTPTSRMAPAPPMAA